MKTTKETVQKAVNQFYGESITAARQGNTKQQHKLFLQIVNLLEELMPVQISKTPTFKENFQHYNQIIVAINHIPTPRLFEISEDSFYAAYNVDRSISKYRVIGPNIIRHYPIINYLQTHNYKARVLTGTYIYPKLEPVFKGWDYVTINEKQNNQLGRIMTTLRNLPEDRWAFIIFPEGKDSHDNLEHQTYQLNPFRSGFAVIAQQLGIPVLPISLTFNINRLEYNMYIHNLVFTSSNQPPKEMAKQVEDIINAGILHMGNNHSSSSLQ